MRRADVDVGLGRHAGVADGVGADEAVQVVLVGHARGIAQVLDQLEAEADREDLGALDVLDIVGQLAPVAAEIDAVAEGVFGRLLRLHDLGAQLLQALVDLGAALLHLRWMSKPFVMSSCSATLKRRTSSLPLGWP